MPTDAERREVARRLRSFVTDDSMNATVDASHVLYVLGLPYADIDRDYFCGYDVARLADLIEPSEPEDFYRVTYSRSAGGSPYMLKVRSAKGDEWDFWRIDRDALLALAGDMQDDAAICPHEDCRDHVAAYARRIREALGVDK